MARASPARWASAQAAGTDVGAEDLGEPVFHLITSANSDYYVCASTSASMSAWDRVSVSTCAMSDVRRGSVNESRRCAYCGTLRQHERFAIEVKCPSCGAPF